MDTRTLARRRFLLLAAGVAAASLAGCGTADTRTADTGATSTGGTRASAPQPADGPVTLVSDETRTAPGDPAAARAALAGFGSAFLGAMLAAEPAVNAAISPYSLFTVLAMARAGAKGRTAEQIDAALGLPGAPAQGSAVAAVDAGVSAALDAAESASGTVVVRAADETWIADGFPVHQDYLDTLAREFGVAARSADFAGDPEGMRQAVNTWVAERTNDLIPELFPADSITRDTLLVLVDALYLKASWAAPFGSRADGQFLTVDGRAVTVPMMSGRSGAVPAVTGPGWTAVTLPYTGGGLAMTVLLPDGGLDAVLGDLPGVLAAAATTAPADTRVDVTLPAFSVRSSPDAKAAARALGVTDLFTAGAADLSGVADTDLVADAFVHQCVVTVDEQGTEAAAATGMTMMPTSARPAAPLVVDRPFLFWIADTTTQAPLFLGTVGDPSLTA